MQGPAVRRLRARSDSSLRAVLRDLVPLAYAAPPREEDDVLAHVRAASAIRRSGARLIIVQDDVNAIALHEPRGGVRPVLLPVGPGGKRAFDDARGNKAGKMDLEACARLPDGRLLAFGSGSTPAREQLVCLDASLRPVVVDGSRLYRMFRAHPEFSGSELNIEGAVVIGDRLRLFQRGNGEPRDGLTPVDATADLPLQSLLAWLETPSEPPPPLSDIVQYDLGRIDGVPLTFTDAALTANGELVFIACAEASPDATRDGDVVGCRFGWIAGDLVRTTDVVGLDGRPTRLKVEGLEPCPDVRGEYDVVIDVDRADAPALLGRLEVRG